MEHTTEQTDNNKIESGIEPIGHAMDEPGVSVSEKPLAPIPFYRRKRYIISAGFIGLVAVSLAVFGGDGGGDFETQKVAPSTIRQIVRETGTVTSGNDIDLAFARGGRVASVLVKKGDHVQRGQVLASLDVGSLNAELRQALAALELERGQIQQNSLTLTNALDSLIDEILDAYVSADNVVQGTIDQLFEEASTSRPKFGIFISQGATTYYIGAPTYESSQINGLRAIVEDQLIELKSVAFTASHGDAKVVARQTERALLDVQALLAAIASSLNDFVAEDTDVQLVYGGFKTDISTARTTTGTALNTLRAAMQAVENAQTTLEIPGQGTNSINLQEIRLEQAQARVDAIRSNINDAIIVAPIAGTVTSVDINVGEVINSTATAIGMISDNNLEISVAILEDDIAFVDAGDSAEVMFDAYENIVFEAEVIYVSPKAEEEEGSPTFEVILVLKEDDPRIRAGLSVDVDIITEVREEVLSVPTRSIIEEDSMLFVRVLVDESSYRRQQVSLGLRGDGGVTEVLEGLEIGTEIITFIDEEALNRLTLVE